MFSSAMLFSAALACITSVLAFDMSRSDNVAVYWGQDSWGNSHLGDTANYQQRLSYYCNDNAIDTLPIAFLNVFFDIGGLPSINLANTCSPTDNGAFPGTNLANCQFLAADIQACQAKGKIVTLALGGATGGAVFSSDAQAKTFADTIWNLFLGGSSSTRPFGAAVLDGVDLDIEGGGTTYFASFVTQLKTHTNSASKRYYYTAAPQCPYPDAYMAAVLNAASFDAIYVQFYNNYCSVSTYPNVNSWNFADWANYAKNVSPNKNVKIYIGAPGASTGGGGYTSAGSLIALTKAMQAQYGSIVGGVMLWDASQAYVNGRFDLAIKNGIAGGATTPPTNTTTITTTTTSKTTSTTSTTIKTTSTTSTTTVGTGSCSGVAVWQSTIAYTGGLQVTYGGHLWTAKWWTQADVPGGSAQSWTDSGACTGLFKTANAPLKTSALAALTATSSLTAEAAKSTSATSKVKQTQVEAPPI